MCPNRGDRLLDRVLEWYDSHGRHDLPWRASDAAPLEVLDGEITLQQTSVGQVLGVYPEFVEGFPAPTAIADTTEDDPAEEIRPL